MEPITGSQNRYAWKQEMEQAFEHGSVTLATAEQCQIDNLALEFVVGRVQISHGRIDGFDDMRHLGVIHR